MIGTLLILFFLLATAIGSLLVPGAAGELQLIVGGFGAASVFIAVGGVIEYVNSSVSRFLNYLRLILGFGDC